MVEKFRNAIRNPRVEFCLVPSPALRELLIKDEHPAVQKLPPRYKTTFISLPEGAGVALGRDLVLRYVEGKSSEDERFILDRCDIRVVGSPDIAILARS